MKLCVFGLGYVGTPVCKEAVFAGLEVTGVDPNDQIVNGLNAGHSHIEDISDDDVADMRRLGFRAVTSPGDLRPDVMVICVPTPLSASDGPDLGAVCSATRSAASVLAPGTLVVLESTTYPGTTDEVVRPILEQESGLAAGLDFNLAFSPERIDPGNPTHGLRNTPKVVGGLTPACTEAAAQFYRKLCDRVVEAKSCREAEMAKLLENTFRDVNIALVNELAVYSHEMGIDLWDAIQCASTKPFGFMPFYPGPGVAGHCLGVDCSYLSHKVRTELGHPVRFIELAQEINRRMPGYVVDRAAELLNNHGMPLKGAKIVLQGVTYKADVADLRESKAPQIAARLAARGARISYHDPLVPDWHVDGVAIPHWQPGEDADLVILLQAHRAFDLGQMTTLLLDTRGRANSASPNVQAL